MFNSVMFYGIVEGVNDPLKNGRVQVRVHGIHTPNKAQIPSETLHWAMVGMPVTSASVSGVGDTPRLVPGSAVMGMFLDGENFQQPIVMWSVPSIPREFAKPSAGFNDPRTGLNATNQPAPPASISYTDSGPNITEGDRTNYPRYVEAPDLNPRTRGEDTHIKTNKSASRVTGIDNPQGSWSEPSDPFNAQYPFNRVMESESGHAIELDDTPGAERVQVYHRTGSFIEYSASGDVVYKATGNSYFSTLANDYSYVGGKKLVTVEKGMGIRVNNASGSENLDIEVGDNGNLNITVEKGNVTLNVNDGNVNKYVNGNVTETVTGNYTLVVTGSYSNQATTISNIASGIQTIQGSMVNIN